MGEQSSVKIYYHIIIDLRNVVTLLISVTIHLKSNLERGTTSYVGGSVRSVIDEGVENKEQNFNQSWSQWGEAKWD